jgi:hypothetical protein
MQGKPPPLAMGFFAPKVEDSWPLALDGDKCI